MINTTRKQDHKNRIKSCLQNVNIILPVSVQQQERFIWNDAGRDFISNAEMQKDMSYIFLLHN